METQGISVDSQVLIDASNTLKVNAFFSSLIEQFVIMNLNYFKNFWSRSRESFSLFFFLQMKIQKVEGEAHKVR